MRSVLPTQSQTECVAIFFTRLSLANSHAGIEFTVLHGTLPPGAVQTTINGTIYYLASGLLFAGEAGRSDCLRKEQATDHSGAAPAEPEPVNRVMIRAAASK